MSEERLVGVTVMPEYFQTEGVDAVLDNLIDRAGVTAIGTSPYVMAPADAQSGGREPPADGAAGKVRLLDRPLWGKRELFVRTAPSFVPHPPLYDGLRYRPAEPDALTHSEGGVVAEVISGARARGLKVYLQIQAAIPPGYRVQFGGPVDDDQPRLPDGRAVTGRVDRNGSLASSHIRDYSCALIRDLARNYPGIDGLRIDWPEYPPYGLSSMFFDFSAHAMAAAERLGIDGQRMQRDVGALYDKLHGGLRDADLLPWLAGDGGRGHLLDLLVRHPGVADLLRLKARLGAELLVALRSTLDEAGGTDKELVAHAFPPPWSTIGGMDYGRVARHASSIGVKLYTMHWPMMLRAYGDVLRAANDGLSDDLLARCLTRLLDTADDEGPASIEKFAYPEPDEAHPVGREAQARKILQARMAAGSTPVHAMAHGYGPIDDVTDRLEVAWQASDRKIWVNRYGYLADAKLDRLGAITG